MQKQVDELQKEVGELRSIVNLEKTVILEKDKTINLRPRSSLSFSYDTPYAGYITITFTATGDVELRIGSNSTKPKYYFHYPESSITQLLNITLPSVIIVPGTQVTQSTPYVITVSVTRGTTYIVFENPSYLSGVTVTFTITYTY